MGAAIWIAAALICCAWLLIVIHEIRYLSRPAPVDTKEGP